MKAALMILVAVAALVLTCGFLFRIKGNGDSMIYHLPSCGSYDIVDMNNHSEDEWFMTEKQAKEAGFRRAENCSL